MSILELIYLLPQFQSFNNSTRFLKTSFYYRFWFQRENQSADIRVLLTPLYSLCSSNSKQKPPSPSCEAKRQRPQARTLSSFQQQKPTCFFQEAKFNERACVKTRQQDQDFQVEIWCGFITEGVQNTVSSRFHGSLSTFSLSLIRLNHVVGRREDILSQDMVFRQKKINQHIFMLFWVIQLEWRDMQKKQKK